MISLCLPLILELVKPILELVTTILEVDLTCDLPLILELLTPFFESGWMLIKGTSDSVYGVATSAFGVRPDFFSISIDISVLALQRNIIHKIRNIQSNSLSSLILKTSDLKHLNLILTKNLDFNLTTQRLQNEVATS